MYKNLRWKVLTIVIVVGIFFAIGVYVVAAMLELKSGLGAGPVFSPPSCPTRWS